MRTIEITEIAALLAENRETEEPLILTRNGKPVAALLPVEDIDLETLQLSMNSTFAQIIERSRQSQKQEGRIFLEDITSGFES